MSDYPSLDAALTIGIELEAEIGSLDEHQRWSATMESMWERLGAATDEVREDVIAGKVYPSAVGHEIPTRIDVLIDVLDHCDRPFSAGELRRIFLEGS